MFSIFFLPYWPFFLSNFTHKFQNLQIEIICFKQKQNSYFVAISNLGDTVIDITRNTQAVSINWEKYEQICESPKFCKHAENCLWTNFTSLFFSSIFFSIPFLDLNRPISFSILLESDRWGWSSICCLSYVEIRIHGSDGWTHKTFGFWKTILFYAWRNLLLWHFISLVCARMPSWETLLFCLL